MEKFENLFFSNGFFSKLDLRKYVLIHLTQICCVQLKLICSLKALSTFGSKIKSYQMGIFNLDRAILENVNLRTTKAFG